MNLFSPFTFLIRQSAWLILILSLGFTLGGLSIYYFDAADSLNIDKHPLKETTTLYDRTGKTILYQIHGEENRRVIDHEAMPETVRFATVAAEDAHFYSHPGIDVIAILRASIANLQQGEIDQGASTITQQLARALFLTREKTWVRKAREAILAIKIERQLSKEEILDLYLNAVPYGSNAYGIEAAAQTFFGKTTTELSLDESAVLAALPNAPTFLSPYGKNTRELIEKKNHILARMLELDFISAEAYKEARDTKTLDKIIPLERKIIAPHFTFFIIKRLEDLYGRKRLEEGGLHVTTTIDLDLQQKAEEVIAQGVLKNKGANASNAALVTIDPITGEILALVGSRDYFDTAIDGQVNVAIEQRQPGSTVKPFAYATAFNEGFEPETPIYDVPINFGPDGSGHDYIPNNYDGKFRGRMTMRDALAQSLNIPAVSTLFLAGIQDTINTATALGITTLTDPSRYGLALVLGGAEVKLLDITSAFGVFGQEGKRTPADGILKITDQDGKNLYFRSAAEQILDVEVSRKINSILSDNAARTPTFGPRSPLAFPSGTVVAAKTGTTQNFRDAWTIGYTNHIALGVWVGNNDNTAMKPGSDGIYVAAPLWREFMNTLLERYPDTGFTDYVHRQPETPPRFGSVEAKTIYINKNTGKEISESKAKKKRASDVEVRIIDGGTTLSYTQENGTLNFVPATLEDLRRIYFPN
ncbi:MAG: penicillin-binding protein [Candidatus Moraniibacteriota bacterium]|nr:MAG: penicillin-binding protein [Candidatus Moranbacteria bacterium]